MSDQILTFSAVEKFCKENLTSITFFSIYKNETVSVRERLEERYAQGDTIPGTQSCHHFEPVSTTTINAKQLCDDTAYLIKSHRFSTMPTPAEIALTVKPNDYATVLFNGYWWLALVEVVNAEEKDVECKFMHPHGPVTNNNFHWPNRDDKGYVPFDKFIMKVDTPKCASNSGRQFVLQGQELKQTNSVFEHQKL